MNESTENIDMVTDSATNITIIRAAFERTTAPCFVYGVQDHPLRNAAGYYVSPVLEDHWNTFQEGWMEALNYVNHNKETK